MPDQTNPAPHVRDATIDDVEAIGRIHFATHLETYSDVFPAGSIEAFPPERRAEMWRQVLENGWGRLWVAEADGSVVGFASVSAPRDEAPVRDIELGAIYLLASHHGSGAGQALLDAALDGGPASLWVLADNPRARAFYARNGFVPDGAEKNDDQFGNVHIVRLVR